MRLTLHTDLSLRLLMFLAVNPDGLATIRDAAERYHVSRNHLMKVARQLGESGFIKTVRGHGGGLRLGRPAAEIGIGDVVRTTEQDFRMVECFDPGRNTCALAPACRLRGALGDALWAFLSALDKYTLADLIIPDRSMRRLLGLTDPVVGT